MKHFSLFGFNICDIFLLGWVCYYLQGILYEEGGMLSTGLLFMLLLISLIYVFKTIKIPNKPIYFKGLGIILVMFTIYGFIHIFSNPLVVHYRVSGIRIESYNYIKAIYLSLLPIYPFYYFARQGYIDENRMKKWFFVFIMSCTLTFFRNQRDVMLEKGVEEITNNIGYLMLSLLPGVVLFRKNSLIQFLLLIYILFFIIIGMKRGAILIAGLTLPFFFVQEMKNAGRKQKTLYIFFLVVLIYIGVRFINYQLHTSEYLMLRVLETTEGDSSGRDSIYSFFIDYFFNKNTFVTFLFGNGANATLNIHTVAAHNDWLEIAINQGLIGLIVYLFYWFCLLKTWGKAMNPEAKMGIAIVGIIFFLKTFFSMSYSEMTYISTCVFGYYLANYRKDYSIRT